MGPGMHTPMAVQVEADFILPLLPSQLAGAQTVPAGVVAQAPRPSQTPVVPQLEAAMATQTAAGSAAPAATGVQVPCLPTIAHELQLPHDADPQQTPSVQWPLIQVALPAQAAPFGERLVHEPDGQVKPATQSASFAHMVRQALGPQA